MLRIRMRAAELAAEFWERDRTVSNSLLKRARWERSLFIVNRSHWAQADPRELTERANSAPEHMTHMLYHCEKAFPWRHALLNQLDICLTLFLKNSACSLNPSSRADDVLWLMMSSDCRSQSEIGVNHMWSVAIASTPWQSWSFTSQLGTWIYEGILTYF